MAPRRRFRSRRPLGSMADIREAFGLPILGVLPEEPLVGDARLGAAGAASISRAGLEAAALLNESLSRFAGATGPRSVMLTSSGPKEGKSSVAISLATAAALAGKWTLLAECDWDNPSFESRLGLQPAPGISQYLSEEAEPQEILQQLTMSGSATESRPVGPSEGALVCIAAGTRGEDSSDLLAGERFTHFLAKVTQAYELVVLDGPRLVPLADPQPLRPAVDVTLVCARLGQVTATDAEQARPALESLPGRRCLVVTGV